jgi:hypothetical protein
VNRDGTIRQCLFSYYKLQPQYRRVSSMTVLLGTAIGTVAWVSLISHVRSELGIPMGDVSVDGIEGRAALWITITVLSAPLLVLPSIMAVAFVIGLIFVVVGRLSLREAIQFATAGRYPLSWFAHSDIRPSPR